MGVDFKICTACSRTFPDCGPYVSCDEEQFGCCANYCSSACAQLRYPEKEVIGWEAYEALPPAEQLLHKMSCVDCRKELESDENLLEFLLEQVGKTREALVAEFRATRQQR
jgi:hypothetical protein